jgi:hypothetical protein
MRGILLPIPEGLIVEGLEANHSIFATTFREIFQPFHSMLLSWIMAYLILYFTVTIIEGRIGEVTEKLLP